MNVKQVIVVRTKYPDGEGGTRGVRRGKEIAQACHASIAFLTRRIRRKKDGDAVFARHKSNFEDAVWEWLHGSFAKVCVRVDSEEELLEIHEKALAAGLESHLITDSGKTEFKEPTNTCLAIGPDEAEKIDEITGHLKLL